MSTTLERLGFKPDDRVAIFHADDIGMCHAANAALQALWPVGVVTSYALMAPCPWFDAAAAYARNTPGVDAGVHITLNSEWPTYRWGPISTRDPASGLIDEQGCFWRSVADVVAHADPEAVAIEMRAQVERALKAGIDITHIDAHMGTALQPPFIEAYLRLGDEYGVPTFLPRMSRERMAARGIDAAAIDLYERILQEREAAGHPTVDNIIATWGYRPEANLLLGYRDSCAALEPGLTVVILHPSRPSAELEAITPGDWLMRAADYRAYSMPEFGAYLDSIGVKRIGYRALRDLLRAH